MNAFELDWYSDDTSDYEEKLNLAKIELARTLEKMEQQNQALTTPLNKFKTVKPTILSLGTRISSSCKLNNPCRAI